MNLFPPDELKTNAHFGKPEKYILPGEFYCSREDIIISTLLGSCISVALFDSEKSLGGMNHFMLPLPKNKENTLTSNSSKYGINAMEELINGLIKLGSAKNNLKAKVFGGSTILRFERESVYDIPKLNISFIVEFLKVERIPIISFSVGGTLPRKLFFFPKTAKILMKCRETDEGSLRQMETQYEHKLLERTNNFGNPLLY